MKRTRCGEPPFRETSYAPEGFLRRVLYLWSFAPVPFFGFSEARGSEGEPWTSRHARPSRRKKRCGLRGSRRSRGEP